MWKKRHRMAERKRQLRQLDTMQQEDDAPLPDIYKVPPVQVQSIDEWTNAEDDGAPVREEPAQNGRSSGVVLRHKQEKTKSVKTRKSFIDRLFGSKHKDKESKKKKGKASKQFTENISMEPPSHDTALPITIQEDPIAETPEATLAFIADDPDDKSERDLTEDEVCWDSKENEPPAASSSADEAGGAHAIPQQDYSGDDSSTDNNNRNMSEDEWNKLVDGVENDMEFPEPPEPEVDYPSEDNNENDVPNGSPRIIQPALGSLEDLPKYLKPASSSENLVEPKKLPNPVGSSKLHQDLHREMESNRRMGVNVLQQKTELKKEFERREDRLKKKEREETEKQKKTEIQKRLEEQKQKYDEQDKKDDVDPSKSSSELSEFQRIRTKIYSNMPS